MTEEEKRQYLDHIRQGPLLPWREERLFRILENPDWPHDPRTSTREALTNPPPALALPPERTQAEEDARNEYNDVMAMVRERLKEASPAFSAIDTAMQNTDPVIAVDWGSGQSATAYGAIQDGKMVYAHDKPVTLYEYHEPGKRKRLTWASNGTVLVREGHWEPGEVEALVNPQEDDDAP